MKAILLAGLMASTILVAGNPWVDQRCMNPAYEKTHVIECRDAVHPKDYH